MKKIIILYMLVTTGMTETLFAQNSGWVYVVGKTKTEQLFDIVNSSWLRHKFVISLKNGNTVTVQLTNKTELEKILNLDSIISAVAKNLLLFKDSLKDEIMPKRVDYLNDEGGKIKIRIREYPQVGNSFVLAADGPALLKIEQDTLNILGHETMEKAERVSLVGVYVRLPYKITVYINDINKLETLVDGTLNSYMQEINKQWNALKKWTPENNWKTNLYGYYGAADQRFNHPVSEPHLRNKKFVQPYVQVGLQNINNLLTTSVGAGIELVNKINSTGQNRYQLLWEPYFFFDKETDGKFRMRRNDFLTFQYITIQTTNFGGGAGKIEFTQNLSLGYLIHRSGEYFRNNTFKLGLPGVRFKFVALHPEFIFNNFLRNFQPSLKLFLDLD